MKLKLQDKWYKISKYMNAKEQNDFLYDSLKLYESRPLNYLYLYLSSISVLTIFVIVKELLVARFVLLSLIIFTIIILYRFNKLYTKFVERWFE